MAIPAKDRGFRHIRSPFGTLIIPKDTKQSWTIAERPFRSLLIAEDGRVLSTGFPKFGNLREHGFEDHLEELRTALTKGHDLWITDKVDGTLIIRAVIDGQVHWRTRGSWALGPFTTPVQKLIAAHGPLNDPGFEPARSLLFEYCSASPRLRVVLAHSEDSLTLLGAIDHHTLTSAGRPELERLAERSTVPLVGSVSLQGSLNEWRKEVAGWTGREGVVIRLPSGGMIKLKSSAYLTLHRLKTSFSMRAAKRLILNEGLRTKEQFTGYLQSQGADWETVTDLEPMIDATAAACAQADERFDGLRDQVDLLCITHRGRRDRQLQAINALSSEPERQTALLLLDGREAEAETTLERLLVEQALVPFDDKLLQDLEENLQEG